MSVCICVRVRQRNWEAQLVAHRCNLHGRSRVRSDAKKAASDFQPKANSIKINNKNFGVSFLYEIYILYLLLTRKTNGLPPPSSFQAETKKETENIPGVVAQVRNVFKLRNFPGLWTTDIQYILCLDILELPAKNSNNSALINDSIIRSLKFIFSFL